QEGRVSGLVAGHRQQSACFAVRGLEVQADSMLDPAWRLGDQGASDTAREIPAEQRSHLARRDLVRRAHFEASPFDVGLRLPRVAEQLGTMLVQLLLGD